MIIELLVNLFFGLIDLILNLIPSINIDINLDGFEVITKYMGMFYFMIPFEVILANFSIIFLIQNAQFFIKIFNFILRKIPGIS